MIEKNKTCISIPSDVLFQELGDESVLLNMKSGQYYGLDDVGTHMWQLLAKHQDVYLILQEMAAEYDVDEATLASDLSNFVTELTDLGLLQVHAMKHQSV